MDRILFFRSEKVHIIDNAATIFEELVNSLLFRDKLVEKDQLGIYFCVMRAEDAVFLCIEPFGDMTAAKAHGRFTFCQEKITRLHQHPEHNLSRQSENEALNQFRGAVRGHKYLYSCSGLPGDLDEVFCAWLAFSFGDLTKEEVLELLKDNEAFQKIQAAGGLSLFT